MPSFGCALPNHDCTTTAPPQIHAKTSKVIHFKQKELVLHSAEVLSPRYSLAYSKNTVCERTVTARRCAPQWRRHHFKVNLHKTMQSFPTGIATSDLTIRAVSQLKLASSSTATGPSGNTAQDDVAFWHGVRRFPSRTAGVSHLGYRTW